MAKAVGEAARGPGWPELRSLMLAGVLPCPVSKNIQITNARAAKVMQAATVIFMRLVMSPLVISEHLNATSLLTTFRLQLPCGAKARSP